MGVTGLATLATGSHIGNLTLANGSITDSSGAISFGNENLSTTGTLGAGVATLGNTTTGTLGCGNITVGGAGAGQVTAGTNLDLRAGTNVAIQTTDSGAPSPTIFNNSVAFEIDEVGHDLVVRVKYSDGTLKTGIVNLS